MKARGIFNMIKNRFLREEIYNKPEYWDAKAKEFEGDAISLWPNNNLNSLYEKEHLDFFNRFLGDITNLKAADIGCGIGNVTRLLAQRGANVTGFDFSERTIEIAIKKSTNIRNINFVVKSVFDFCEPNEYDLIVCRGCLTVACKNKQELSKALQNIYESLKVDGKFLIIEPIHRGIFHRVLNIDLADFLYLMEKIGYNIGYVEEMHFLPVRLMLSHLNISFLITKYIYELGQWIMNKAQLKWGDYKAIYAEKSLT